MNYYNNIAQKYFNETVNLKMNEHYNKFIAYIPKNSKILDVGCGSGRDSRYFIENGYNVDSIDNACDLSLLASMYIGKKVKTMDIKSMNFNEEYNGIWCSASLLHILPENIEYTLKRINNALVKNGYLYLSLKEGNNDIVIDDGRTSVLYSLDFIKNLLENNNFEIKDFYKNNDNMGRNTIWFNIIAKKKI